MSSSDQQSAHKLSESPAAVEVQKSASVNVCLGVRLNTQKGREFKGRCVCVPACVCACVCVCVPLLAAFPTVATCVMDLKVQLFKMCLSVLVRVCVAFPFACPGSVRFDTPICHGAYKLLYLQPI